MSNSPNMGFARRVGAGATAPSTKEFEFLSCGVEKVAQHLQSDGIRGIRGRQGESVVDGVYTVGGPLVLEPKPDEWGFWLLRMLGGGSNPNYTLAETVPDFVLDVEKGADVFRYAGMKVNTWSIRSAANQPVQLTLDLQGKTETGGITFPSISGTLSLLQPYVHHNTAGAITLGGVAYEADNLEISGSNALVLDRFLNSQTRTALPESDRIITVAADFPFGDQTDALYNLAVAGLSSNSIVWTNGTYSLTLNFPKLQAPTSGPQINARTGEVMRRITFQARRSGSSAECSAANDETA